MDNEFNFDDFEFENFDSFNSGLSTDGALDDTPDVADIVTNLRKRVMVVVALVDISPSMRGAKIGAVNDALRNVINELRQREHGNTAAEIRMGIIKFATQASLVTESPVPVDSYSFRDIEPVQSGCTSYSNAFYLLNERLSSKYFMNSAAGAYTPLLVLMTDGKPSDPALYQQALRELEENKWFKYSTRAAIAIGREASDPNCRKALIEFTGDEKNVFEARNAVMLAKQIELVTLTGVDFATKQGSIQNTADNYSDVQQVYQNEEVIQTLPQPKNEGDKFTFEEAAQTDDSSNSSLGIDLSDINDDDWSF